MGLSAFFHSWGLPREPQEAQEGSQEAPKELQKPQKKSLKLNPKINKFCTHFGTQTGSQNGSPKTPPKKSSSERPFPHISGVQIMPRQKINERGKKRVLTGIILYKRKGGIRPYSFRDPHPFERYPQQQQQQQQQQQHYPVRPYKALQGITRWCKIL